MKCERRKNDTYSKFLILIEQIELFLLFVNSKYTVYKNFSQNLAIFVGA